MEYLLNYELKYFSKYMDNIPVINGVETHMSRLDLQKWKHYSAKEDFIFQLAIFKDRTLSMNILMNGPNIIDSVELNKQDIALQTFNKVQFSVNCPIISCKYFNHDSMLTIFQRRFQMTLKYESDFNCLTNILRQMGFTVKNAKLLSNKVEKENYSLNSIAGNMVLPLVESSFISNSRDTSYFKHLKTKPVNRDIDETTLPLLETQTNDFTPTSITYRSNRAIGPNTNISGMFSNVAEQHTSLTRVENPNINKNYLQENLFIGTSNDPIGLINSNLEVSKDNKNESVRNDLVKDFQKGQEQTQVDNSSLFQNSTSHQTQKQVTSQDMLSQKEIGNLVSNSNGVNCTKNLKKKVHITRKLIKTKLKDKKFRKWVCINYG